MLELENNDIVSLWKVQSFKMVNSYLLITKSEYKCKIFWKQLKNIYFISN